MNLNVLLFSQYLQVLWRRCTQRREIECRCTVQPVFKDHPWEENNLVFVNRWSLITEPFMQKMSNWEIKSLVVIDRELLNKGGL